MMVGRLDDWIEVLAKRDGMLIDPGYPHWAGIACFKKAYAIFQERGYRARLLAAAYRHHLHWSELIGGDVVAHDPVRVAAAVQRVRLRGRRRGWTSRCPSDRRRAVRALPGLPARLRRRRDDASRSSTRYGATVRTLRGFIGSYHDLVAMVRDFMLPDPDVA